MTEQMLEDKMAQMIRVGFVNARQPEKMRVKVTLRDTTTSELVTDWLPVLCPRACKDMQYDLPDIGDQVLCLFLAYGLEQGFVVGAMYGQQTPPVQSGDKWHRLFEDGTYLEYDRSEHKLTADVKGDVDIKATGSVSGKIDMDLSAEVQGSMKAASQGPASVSSQSQLSLDAPAMNMGGGEGSATSAAMQGTFRVSQGDIVVEGISFLQHVHICPACGSQTSPPVGGGSGGSGSGGEAGGSGGGDGNSSTGSGDDNKPANGSGGNASELVITDEVVAAYMADSANIGLSLSAEQTVNIKRLQTDVENSISPLEDIHSLIMCLPKIAEAEAKRNDGQDKIGWELLARFFRVWLSGAANDDPRTNPDVIVLGDWFWNWVMQYERAVKKKDELIKNYINQAAQEELNEKLIHLEKFTNKIEHFNFIYGGWQDWDNNYYQRISCEMPYLSSYDDVNGIDIALGSFSIRLLSEGYVEPLQAGGHSVHIIRLAGFIYDEFNFKGPAVLGCWDCESKSFKGYNCITGTMIGNGSFNQFRDEFEHGCDFRIFSRPHILENFTGKPYVTSL